MARANGETDEAAVTVMENAHTAGPDSFMTYYYSVSLIAHLLAIIQPDIEHRVPVPRHVHISAPHSQFADYQPARSLGCTSGPVAQVKGGPVAGLRGLVCCAGSGAQLPGGWLGR